MTTEAALPQLTLDIEREGTTATVRLHGKLVFGAGDILYSNVRKLIPESRLIVLDLTDLAYMDSMGLGTLVRLYVTARTHGSTIELIHIGERIRQMLEVTDILSVFAKVGEHGIRFLRGARSRDGSSHPPREAKARWMGHPASDKANADSLRE